MAKRVDLSKPVELQTSAKEVHEFTHLSGKKIVFITQPGLFKTPEERDRCFFTVWERQGETLRDRAVVEIKERPQVHFGRKEAPVDSTVEWERVDLQEDKLRELLLKLWSGKKGWYGTEASIDREEMKEKKLKVQTRLGEPYHRGEFIIDLEQLPEETAKTHGMVGEETYLDIKTQEPKKREISPKRLLAQAFYDKVREKAFRQKLKEARRYWASDKRDALAKEVLEGCGYRFGENPADDASMLHETGDLLVKWYEKWRDYKRRVQFDDGGGYFGNNGQKRAKRPSYLLGLDSDPLKDQVVATLLERMPRGERGYPKRIESQKERKKFLIETLKTCNYNFGRESDDTSVVESLGDLLERAEQWFEQRKISSRAHQTFTDVEESKESYSFSYEVKDVPGVVETEVETQAPQYAFKVHALALDSFSEQTASSNSIIAFFTALYHFLTFPLARLYHLIFTDKNVHEIADSFDTIDHEHVGTQNYSTFLAQIRFVSRLLGRVESKGGQRAQALFSSAYTIGRLIADAQATEKLDRRNKIIEDILRCFFVFTGGYQEQLIIPVGIGEGKEYTTHLLIFEKRVEKIILKHLALLPPTMDRGKFQTVTTYDVSGLAVSVKIYQLIHALVSLQAYEDKAHAREKREVGPTVIDETLDTLLLDYGTLIEERNPIEQKGSRDPVKALSAALQLVVIERGREGAVFDTALDDVISSKSNFYLAYVNELISFIESNEAKLSATQQVRLLQSLQWYIGKVKHYMEKEVGLDAALSVTERLSEFVLKKLPNQERIKQAEQQDADRLETIATLFSSKLDGNFSEAMRAKSVTVIEETSRVSAACWEKVEQLKEQVSQSGLTTEQRTQALEAVKELKGEVQKLLERGESKAAKMLSYGILHSLPPAMHKRDGEINFWDSLETKEEIKSWSNTLFEIAEQMWQAALRSGTYPLPPHEAFEYNVIVPLTLRRLFGLTLPYYEREFRIALEEVQHKPAVIARLEQAKQEFIRKRKAELQKKVEAQLKVQWEREDEADKARVKEHRKDISARNSHRDAQIKEWRQQRPPLSEAAIAARLAHWNALNPEPVLDPSVRTAAQKKREREEERVREIERAWREDRFLNDLQAINVRRIDQEWDRMINESYEHRERMEAVRGRFARIIGISKGLYASAYAAEKGGEGLAGRGKEIDSWMMRPDLSLVIGVTPEQDDRFEACRRMYRAVPVKSDVDVKVMAEQLSPFLIGYDQLGDGLHFVGWRAYEKESALTREVYRKLGGYFKDERDGLAHLSPYDLTTIKRLQMMARVMDHPDAVGYFHSGGLLGEAGISAIADPARVVASGVGALVDSPGSITAKGIKEEIAHMKDVHLIFGLAGFDKTPVFTLSDRTSAYHAKYYVDDEKQIDNDTSPRAAFLGQASQSMAEAEIVEDNEREALFATEYGRKTVLDPAQEFLLKATNMGNSRVNPRPSASRTIYRDQDHDTYASYLSVPLCMHFMYQYPRLLEEEFVQHKLYHALFQRGLVREHLRADPQFFVRFGPILKQILQSRAVDGDHGGELFVMEVAERIRRQAIAEKNPFAGQISKALPEYNKETIETWYYDAQRTSQQKLFATFLVSYYVSYPPEVEDVDGWKDLFEAFSLMQRSPIETGHTGLQSELTHAVQERLLPKIYAHLKENQEDRENLLSRITGKQGRWVIDPRLEYGFQMAGGGGELFSVDLRSGNGFAIRVISGERGRLPIQVREGRTVEEGGEAGLGDFQFLFGNLDPLVESKGDPEAGITEYRWTDRDQEITYFVYYDEKNKRYQIQQETKRGTRYQFQRVGIDQSVLTKVFGYHNKTVEKLLLAKGVWVRLDKEGRKEMDHVYVARHGHAVENDSIRLYIDGDKIASASMGKGTREKWVCCGLSKRDAQLFSCRAATNLLLLSADKKHVDEVRFPDGLTLMRSHKDHSRWVVTGREDWEWRLHDTEELEKRFGKNYRDYLLPLKNQRTGEEEFWIYPYMATSLEKKGSEVRLIKTAEEALRYIQNRAADAIGVEEAGVEGMSRALPLLGIAERFLGTDALMDHLGEAVGSEFSSYEEGLKEALVPSPTRYTIDKVKGESGSHCAFLYLSHLAALRGDWGMASRYLTQMVENGNTRAEELTQLETAVKKQILLGIIDKLKDLREISTHEELPKADSVRKTAYTLKLFLSLLRMKKLLEAEHKKKVSFFSELPFNDGERSANSRFDLLQSQDPLELGIFYFASDYRSYLKERVQELKEQGLLLTSDEENTFNEICGSSTLSRIAARAFDLRKVLALAKEAAPTEREESKQLPEPFHFPIPTPAEMDAFVEQMAKSLNPHPPSSIFKLHCAKGSYPKWGTVGANFWSYWEWIFTDQPTIEDLAFLFHPIPPGEKYRAETETARRLLLMLFHYKHSFSDSNSADLEINVRGAHSLQKRLPDITSMEERSARYRKEAEEKKEGQGWLRGLWKVGKAELYAQYVEWRKANVSAPQVTEIGGVNQQRGDCADFIAVSKHILHHFVDEYFAHRREEGLVIRAQEQLGGEGSILSAKPEAVVPILDTHGVTRPQKPLSTLEKLKERMWERHVEPLLLAAPALPEGREKALTLAVLKQLFFSLLDSEWSLDVAVLLPLEIPPMFAGMFLEVVNAARAEYLANLPKAAQFARARAQERVAVERNLAWRGIQVTPSSKGPEVWQAYFTPETAEAARPNIVNLDDIDNTDVWDKRGKRIERYLKAHTSPMEEHANEKILRGVAKAAEEFKEKSKNSLNVRRVGALRKQLDLRLSELTEEESSLRGEILAFSRSYAEALEISHLYAETARVTSSQIFELVLDKYQTGKLGRIGSAPVQNAFEEMITHFLLTATERQQLTRAKRIVEVMLQERAELYKATFGALTRFLGSGEATKLQAAADSSVTWLLNSQDLFAALSEGSNRLRYADESGNLSEPKLARKYLVTEYRRKWIIRLKAKEAVEAMLDRGERFVKVRMGIGKSTFIFPLITRLALERGKEPVLVTTEALIGQLQGFVDHKVFIFHFDINYGLKPKTALSDVETYLDSLIATLSSLKREGRYVLTTPGRLASLRNKRIELQDQLSLMKPGRERSDLFRALQKLKRIEGYFKGKGIVYFQDEDVNLDISFEYNNAIGKFRQADTVRYNMTERFVYALLKDPKLKEMLLSNTVRTITDSKKAMRPFAHTLYRDTAFWVSHGWKEAQWKAINEEQFVRFVLGKCPALPKGMPAWNLELSAQEQEHLCYVGSLKTLLSRTFPAVYHVHADLGRGFRESNGCAVDPYLDGFPKPNTQYGEESELIMHHFFHYLRKSVDEKFFMQKAKELAPRKDRISPVDKTTWANWYHSIGHFAAEHTDGDLYAAFSHPDMYVQRIQFLRHIMLETDYVKVFFEQIVCNSQDVTLGAPVYVGSGTGDPYAMNLADPKHDTSSEPELITGETLLCVGDPKLGFDTPVAIFADPLAFMSEKAKDPHCRALINQGYEVKGNRMKQVAETLRHTGGSASRQLIFRDSASHNKLMWHPGSAFSPESYVEEDVDPRTALFLYGPADTRGVDFQIPRSNSNYGVLLVDINTNRDDFEQALWRMRQLGSGQRGEIAIDEKLAKRVRELCHLQPTDKITIGHVFNTLKLRSLQEDELRHTKAAAFRARTPLKLDLDRILARPFDIPKEGPIALLEECEMALSKACRGLYIVTSEIDWAHELIPAKKIDSIQFLRDLYMGQLDSVERIGEQIREFVARNLPSPVVQINERCAALQEALDTVLEKITEELEKLDNEETQAFLHHNLPKKVDSSIDNVSRNEQQVEQQVEQEQEVEQEVEQVVVKRHYSRSCNPLNYDAFTNGYNDDTYSRLDGDRRQEQQDWYWPLTNGRFASNREREFKFLDGMFVSERAKELLLSISAGQPVVYLLVVEEAKTGNCRSCLVTATDWEQTIAPELRRERESREVPKVNVALYALSHQKFKGRVVLDGGKSLPKKIKAPDFYWKLAIGKLYIGWTKLTKHEKMILKIRIREDATTLQNLIDWLKTQNNDKAIEFLNKLYEEMQQERASSS